MTGCNRDTEVDDDDDDDFHKCADSFMTKIQVTKMTSPNKRVTDLTIPVITLIKLLFSINCLPLRLFTMDFTK